MNRQAIIKAAYFAVLAMGNKPSRRSVERMIRKITDGVGFASADVAAWFRANPQYQLSRAQSPEPVQNQYRTTLEPFAEPLTERQSSVAQNQYENLTQNPSHAHAAKVLVKNKRNVDTPYQPGQLSLLPDAALKASKRKNDTVKTKVESEVEQRAFAIRDAVARCVQPLLNGITISAWKLQNARAAMSLAEANKTPNEVVAYWHAHTAWDGRPFIRLDKLQEDMVKTSLPQRQAPKNFAKPQYVDPYRNLRYANVGWQQQPTDQHVEAA